MPSKSDYVALASFRKSLRKFLRYVENNARLEGVTPQQHQVLLAVKGQEGRDWASINDLVEALQIKHHAMVGLVDRCQALGLLERRQGSEDRRVVQVSLTPLGEGILARVTERSLHELRNVGTLTRALEEI